MFPNRGEHRKPLWGKLDAWCEAKVDFSLFYISFRVPEGELLAVEMGHYELPPLGDISLFLEILVGHVPN